MITNQVKAEREGHRFSWRHLLWLAVAFVFVGTELYAQNYEMTLNQRRMGDQIGVEVWMRSLNSGAPNIGNMSIAVVYNNDRLTPAAIGGTNPASETDSIYYDMDVTNPYRTISSSFADAVYGYSPLDAQAADADNGSVHAYVFQLDVTTSEPASVGFQPSTSGRGSYVGMLKFDINDMDLTDSDLTEIAFNPYSFVGNIQVFDIDGTNQTENTQFVDPGDFNIRGITVLNPNGPNQAVNRFPNPALQSLDPNQGYPIYFERSGLLEDMATYGDYGENTLAYEVEFSLDAGGSWLEIGRVAETVDGETALGANLADHVSGELDAMPSGGDDYYIMAGDGTPLTVGHGGIIRLVWEANENFPYRSEQAKIRVSQLEYDEDGTTVTNADIDDREMLTEAARQDQSDFTFVLGRLFFAQLDGTSQYFKTATNYSNATQLTVEAWVNLNSVVDGEPAIIASSAGSASPEEGAWMLYLSEGRYPAFRAREIEGRGPDGYIATLVSSDELPVASDASPIQDSHADNWTHVAATVNNNEISLFVDGERVAYAENDQAVNIRMLTTIHPIWVGVNPNDGIEAEDYLHAGIKEARVWRVALDQDVLRQHIGGVYNPSDVSLGDERTALELDYPLQGARLDIADVSYEQNDAAPLNFYEDPELSASPVNNMINYRPDRSHVRLTSPTGGEGISNLENETFPVRWVAYGLGKTDPNSDDIQIMVSRDGGVSWFDAIDNATPAMPLDAVEIEAGQALWEPYNNATLTGQSDDLQGVVDIEGNYSKSVMLRISGTEARGQENIYDTSGEFTVAPNFAFKNTENNIVKIDNNADLNLSGAIGYMEAWVRPYRFPTTEEAYFPIISKKMDDGTEDLHYALRLLPTGQLEFVVASEEGTPLRTAQSDPDRPIVAPNVLEMDSVWVHVGVYVNLANGGADSEVRFYIDGTYQNEYLDRDLDTDITEQLGSNVTVDNLNTYPVFLGYEPGATDEDSRHFIGEMKEVRFWGGYPGGQMTGTEPSDLTTFIQGALTVRADEIGFYGGTDYAANLLAAYIMNGGSFVNSGVKNSIPVYPANSSLMAKVTGTDYEYEATRPYMKLITPVYEQAVPNTQEDLRIRWAGFDFNRNNLTAFRNGNDGSNHADLEYSVLGGGGLVIQPYQYVASETYAPSYTNAMTLPTSDTYYEFPGTANKSQYAARLNVGITDPDLNNDSTFNDQGEIGATRTNGRLRLNGRATINGYQLEYNNSADGLVPTLRVESPLFDITPPSNFTVRVLLEGLHEGAVDGIQKNLGAAYDDGGLMIRLFTENGGQPQVEVDLGDDSDVSQYENTTSAFDVANINAGDNNFANVPYVFTELPDGEYFVKVEHINHLPVMSRYAAPFSYSGDDPNTWGIESGWDFRNWDPSGTNEALLQTDMTTNPPSIGSKYTAWGNFETDANQSGYASTALIYNDGRDGDAANQLPAMVGGDAYKDSTNQINAADRAQVLADNGGNEKRSDITGDGVVNSDDREIVYRNNGKVSSLTAVSQVNAPIMREAGQIHPDHYDLSMMFIRAEREYEVMKAEGISKKAKKGGVTLLSAIDYKVSANPFVNNGYIDVPLYIENEGGDFNMANATFGIQYDPSTLRFVEMVQTEEVIFSDKNDLGYFAAFSSPFEDTESPISDLRTIDINYDSYSTDAKPGQLVPSNKTYLGTLRFSIVNPQGEYIFNWYEEVTSVHAVESGNVTSRGYFEPIQPILIGKDITITNPNGGEIWRAGNLYTVTWTKPVQDQLVFIEYSTNSGASWNRINNEAIPAVAGKYNWLTPQINSVETLVRLVDANSGAEIDRSDATFELAPAPVEIIRPAATDGVYSGAAQDYIRWSVDKSVTIRFEFSADGIEGWMPVTPEISSDMNQIEWTVPTVNTKEAIVRMVNANTNEVMAVSTPFKILAGSLTITSPRENDIVKVAQETNVRWMHDNVSRFDLQFSADGGSTWNFIGVDVNALKTAYKWIPTDQSDNAVIRAIFNGDPEMEYDRTPAFIVEGNNSAEDLVNIGYEFNMPKPNPMETQADLSFTLPVESAVTMTVYNSAGAIVDVLLNGKLISAGSHTVTFEGRDLPAGMYMVRLQAGEFNMFRELMIVR
ncbi:MAG: LamG-like jellyroll fold domain-containing protein [Candidatus Kapaibacterium sp.]